MRHPDTMFKVGQPVWYVGQPGYDGYTKKRTPVLRIVYDIVLPTELDWARDAPERIYWISKPNGDAPMMCRVYGTIWRQLFADYNAAAYQAELADLCDRECPNMFWFYALDAAVRAIRKSKEAS